MAQNTTRVWRISKNKGLIEINAPDNQDLDAITRGLPPGFYTTFRTFGGGTLVLDLKAHLQRLYTPAITQKITPAAEKAALKQHLARLLEGFPDEARVRLVMIKNGQIYIAIRPLTILPKDIYENGISVTTTDMQRDNPRIKSTLFISSSEKTRKIIAQNDVFEALLLKTNKILEGMTSNFFYIKDGVLGTAQKGILLGVTRRTVLRVARGGGVNILYCALNYQQVPTITEAFLTSSSRGLVPIIRIDDMQVGEGVPGGITKTLSQAYDEYVLRRAERIA